MRALCSMPSTRHYMIGGPSIVAGWLTIPTVIWLMPVLDRFDSNTV